MLVLILVCSACGSAQNPPPPANSLTPGNTAVPGLTQQPSGTTTLPTVFLIVMENHDWSGIKGNPDAPYINDTLLPMASYAQQYYNPPGLHPSEPNYLWLEAGTNFGVTDDGPPGLNHQSSTLHLTTLLNQAHISWKSYQEGIDGTTCPLSDSGMYAPKHNPMVFFDDVTNDNNPQSAYCIAHVRPYSELPGDLQHNSVAHYNFIAPDLCDDMHTACSPSYNAVKQGDTWLASQIPLLLASQAYKKGGIIFITWDEGEGGDGPIGLIVLSPYAKGHGYSNTIHYTHSSTLRTIEEIFGVRPLLGAAAQAPDLSDLFSKLP